MAYFLVQQWWTFPNIGEVLQMDDGRRPFGGVATFGREGFAPAQTFVDGAGQQGIFVEKQLLLFMTSAELILT